jgi:hypothetical protein
VCFIYVSLSLGYFHVVKGERKTKMVGWVEGLYGGSGGWLIAIRKK